MPSETITIEGIPELERALATKVAELKKGAALVVVEETTLIREDAQATAPVDTGELRDGIESEVKGDEGTVRSTSKHGLAVEFGTSKTAAQPHMKPAAERARLRIPKRAAAIFRAVLGG